jgi:ATP synthase protein I
MPKPDDTNWGALATVGLEIAVGVALGAIVGVWIDKKLNSGPWGLLIGIVLGCSAGTYLLIKEATGFGKKK